MKDPVMKHDLIRRAGIRIAVAALGAAPVAGALATPATAAANPSSTASCTDPALSQPFLAWGDDNWYALAPGEARDNFYGGGWTLTGGAHIVTTTLEDGTTGSVLD